MVSTARGNNSENDSNPQPKNRLHDSPPAGATSWKSILGSFPQSTRRTKESPKSRQSIPCQEPFRSPTPIGFVSSTHLANQEIPKIASIDPVPRTLPVTHAPIGFVSSTHPPNQRKSRQSSRAKPLPSALGSFFNAAPTPSYPHPRPFRSQFKSLNGMTLDPRPQTRYPDIGLDWSYKTTSVRDRSSPC